MHQFGQFVTFLSLVLTLDLNLVFGKEHLKDLRGAVDSFSAICRMLYILYVLSIRQLQQLGKSKIQTQQAYSQFEFGVR